MAIKLTRRALAIGGLVTVKSIHELMSAWWTAPNSEIAALVDCDHPFTFALTILEGEL